MFGKFLENLFGNHQRNGEIDAAKTKAREDAKLIEVYFDEFESETQRIINERTQKMLGFSSTPLPPVAIQATVTQPKPDYASMKRHELMKEAAAKDIKFARDATKDDLVALLENN